VKLKKAVGRAYERHTENVALEIPWLAADISGRPTRLLLSHNPDDLLFRETALLQVYLRNLPRLE
jgi:hypothetical protein